MPEETTEQEPRWPENQEFNLTGDPLPEDHPARPLQRLGFTGCEVNIGSSMYSTSFFATKEVRLSTAEYDGVLSRRPAEEPLMRLVINLEQGEPMDWMTIWYEGGQGDIDTDEGYEVDSKCWEALGYFAEHVEITYRERPDT